MNLIDLGKQCVTEAMRAIDNVSAEIVQFKGPTKNVQITADLIAQEKIVNI